MWITADNSQWAWHMRLGHVLLALLIFRVIWGVIGTDTARFSSFVKGPLAVIGYLRGGYDEKGNKGHSPLAALAVLALLGLMSVQVGMGLFAGDPFDGATGPLNPLVGVMTADWITTTHEWFWWLVFGMIGLHLSAIAIYGMVRMENLTGAMIGGQAEKKPGVSDNPPAQWTKALGALAVSVAIAGWIYAGAPPFA
jgi:cytochrome b